MVFEHKGQKFMTDDDLEINYLGKFPEVIIQDKELREGFEKEFGRNFLGGDEIISHRQLLVAKGMNFSELEKDFLGYVKEGKNIKEAVFDKTATGIGRGHSMGGLSGVVLGLHGTKMIDSGLTGLVASRSLVTSGRRRDVKVEDIVVPESIAKRDDLLNEYLEISRDAFKESKDFKERFGRLEGLENFNKALPYNNPADLFIVLPLDTMATLAFEVKQDELNPNGPFLPREIHTLVKRFPEIAEENGIGTMFKQRVNVPRDTYFHYNVFKDPNTPNYVSDISDDFGLPLEPTLVDSRVYMTKGFQSGLDTLKKTFDRTKKITNPEELSEAAIKCMLDTREFVGEYNEAARVKILDSLSFRVWSEQKRHATLRQGVESIYSATKRASKKMKELWPQIEKAYHEKGTELPLDKLEEAMIIDGRLKKNPELMIPYAYHTGRQLMFFDKLVNEGIPIRDAAYMIPRNTRVTTLEHYDLANMIDLELPLRLCGECEPERYGSSWKKRGVIARAIPELKPFLQPKCNVGYCTEGNFCDHIEALRKYDNVLHKETKEVMLKKAGYE